MSIRDPFNMYYNNIGQLNKRWWHRLLRVVFYMTILIGIIIAIIVPLNDETNFILSAPQRGYNKNNTNRVYFIDSVINNSTFNDYKLACFNGSYYSDIFDSDTLEYLSIYRKNEYESKRDFRFFLNTGSDLVKNNDYKSLSNLLERLVYKGDLELKWIPEDKVVNVVKEKNGYKNEHFCIYNSDRVDDQSTRGVYFRKQREDCSDILNVVKIKQTEYTKLLEETASKMIENKDHLIWDEYIYDREGNKNEVKFLSILIPKDRLDNCEMKDIVYYEANLSYTMDEIIYYLYYVFNVVLNLLIVYIIYLIVKLFYYKIILYVIYGSEENS